MRDSVFVRMVMMDVGGGGFGLQSRPLSLSLSLSVVVDVHVNIWWWWFVQRWWWVFCPNLSLKVCVPASWWWISGPSLSCYVHDGNKLCSGSDGSVKGRVLVRVKEGDCLLLVFFCFPFWMAGDDVRELS